ncbi:MAG: site-2 protease family protein [Actinobacteria bacterium]|nr:site-2 protease family protein [Actinomycetota bacterium]
MSTIPPVEAPPAPRPRSPWRKLLAPFVALAALLSKFKFVLLALAKVKILATSGTMLVSVAAYALIWGWRFAVGFVVLLFIHELGHVFEAKRQGIPVTGVYFIPFLGAVMMARGISRDAGRAAWLGLAGPIFGGAASFVTWAIGVAFNSDLFVALAFVSFLINLFNLIPVMPLDGGYATAVFHPIFWVFGLFGLVVMAFVWPNPILIIVLVLGAGSLWTRWKTRDDPDQARFQDITPNARLAIAVTYVGLAALLAFGMSATHVKRTIDDARGGRTVASASGGGLDHTQVLGLRNGDHAKAREVGARRLDVQKLDTL